MAWGSSLRSIPGRRGAKTTCRSLEHLDQEIPANGRRGEVAPLIAARVENLLGSLFGDLPPSRKMRSKEEEEEGGERGEGRRGEGKGEEEGGRRKGRGREDSPEECVSFVNHGRECRRDDVCGFMVECFRAHRNFFCRAACVHFFALEGLLAGVWASQLPEIQERNDLSDSTLGLCGLAVYFGTVAGTPLSGFLITKLGSKWATIAGAISFILSLPLIGIDVNLPYLILAMLMFGIGMGISSFPSLTSPHLTSNFPHLANLRSNGRRHECFCSCRRGRGQETADGKFSRELFGGGCDWLTLRKHLIFRRMVCSLSLLLSPHRVGRRSSLEIFVLSSALTLVTTTVFGGGLYKSADEASFSKLHQQVFEIVDPVEDQENTVAPLLETPSTPQSSASTSLVALCVVGFLGSYGEGAMVTWSVIYFQRYINIPSALQTIGFFTFMICMAIGRFSCDFLRKCFGRRKLIRCSGIFAAVGVCLIIIAPTLNDQLSEILTCEIGVVLVGIGLSTIVPTVFSSAGHLPGTHAGSSIATVAAFTYCGSIVAPPLIGGISQGLDSLRYRNSDSNTH